MADENTDLDKDLEALKSNLNQQLGKHVLEFFATDLELVRAVKGIVETIGSGLKANEKTLFSPSNMSGNIDLLRAAFAKNSKDGDCGCSDGISGGDIVGGDLGWLTELGTFIQTVGDFIKFEKKTFLAILLLIVCKDCDCVCKFINQPECCDDVAGG